MENRVKEYRLKRKMSQAELCEKSGLSRAIIINLEKHGYDKLTCYHMKQLALALKVSPATLFCLNKYV